MRINKYVSAINSYKAQYEDAMKKLAQVKNTEQQNRYGIMEESRLKITVVEVGGLIAPLTPLVIITVDEQKKYSKELPKTLNPVWEVEFILYFHYSCSDVNTGREKIELKLIGKELIVQDTFNGVCTIELADLKDQLDRKSVV